MHAGAANSGTLIATTPEPRRPSIACLWKSFVVTRSPHDRPQENAGDRKGPATTTTTTTTTKRATNFESNQEAAPVKQVVILLTFPGPNPIRVKYLGNELTTFTDLKIEQH